MLGGRAAPALAVALGCTDAVPLEVELRLPPETRAVAIGRRGTARRLAQVTERGALSPILLPLDATRVEVSAFRESPEILGVAPGPLDLPPAETAPRAWPAPLAELVAEPPSPFRPASAPLLSDVGLPHRASCLALRGAAAPAEMRAAASPAVLLPLEGGRVVMFTEGGGAWIFDAAGAPTPWPSGPRVRDGFVDAAGGLWVGGEDGALRRLPPDLGPSAPAPAPVATVTSPIRRLDGPREGTVMSVVAVLADGRVLRLGAQETTLLGQVDLSADAGLEDIAWVEGAAYLAFARSLDLRVADGGPIGLEPVPGAALANGVRRLEARPGGRLFASTKFGELLVRGPDDRWERLEGARSLAGGRDLTAFEDGVAWVDDRGVVYTWGPRTGICPATVPFGPERREGQRLTSVGLRLFVASTAPAGGGVVAGWVEPLPAPR
jgi:hypothetical protein